MPLASSRSHSRVCWLHGVSTKHQEECAGVRRCTRNDLLVVVDAHYTKPPLVESKAGRSSTERILQRSEDAASGPLDGEQCEI